jgi:superfamily I DNA and/or RNA helicase
MNVAMTRARRLLIVIGDSATLSRHPFYMQFLDYAEKHKAHRSAWEWIPPPA